MAKTDQDIIQQILAGEKRAFAELVDRHKDRAMTLAVRMMKNREDAEEALQDAFVRAFNALPRFEWRSSFSTWFYRIVYNVCATMLSKRRDDVRDSLDDSEREFQLQFSSSDDLPDHSFESAEMQRAIREEIDRLSPKYAGVLTMFYVQEMGYEEIVEVTGLPLGTVKARLFRARTMLRNAIVNRFRDELVDAAFARESVDRKENAS